MGSRDLACSEHIFSPLSVYMTLDLEASRLVEAVMLPTRNDFTCNEDVVK